VGLAVAVVVLAAAPAASAGGTAVLAAGAPRPVSQHAGPAARFGALRLGQAGPGRIGQTMPQRAGSQGDARGSVVLDGSPGAPVASPRTDTVYVPIQCHTSFCGGSGAPAHVLDVISTATCNTKITSGCRVVARARVGSGPLAAAIDNRTGTVYVVNGSSGTVSVLNGTTCNAHVTTGCRQPVATVTVGKFPVAAAVNPATRTLYVANLGAGSVSVINVARCNAQTTTGCGRPPRTVRDKAGPDSVSVNVATDTIYTANAGLSGNGDTVSVIDGATCNGHTGRGCGRTPASVTVGASPSAVAVDQATDTVYVADYVNEFNGGSVSVVNGARCNARTTAGCGDTPPAVPTGIGTGSAAVDQALHTVFAVNQGDNTLSAINTRTCNGKVTSGCHRRPPNQQAAAPGHGPRYNPGPSAFALLQRTGTAYVANIGGVNILSVTSVRRCNAITTAGCRAEAPAVPEHESLLSADPATGTIYASNLSLPQIDVINSATCRAGRHTGCAPVAEIPVKDPQANVGAVDHGSHTLYAADPFAGTVAVINTATCNAGHTAGCAADLPVLNIGAFPNPPVINPATHSLYVSYGAQADRVAVVNTAICNATDTSGCGQKPAVAKVGPGTSVLAVSQATDTVYAPNAGAGFSGNTVSVINGAACNGTDHSGCGHLAATVTVGRGPFGVAVNDHAHAVYVANNANGDSPGTLSVINSAACNGTHTTGCQQHFPTMPTGRAPLLVAADAHTSTVYVTDFESAAVTILTGAPSRPKAASDCRTAAREQPTGSGPFGIAVDDRAHTVYVANGYLPGSLSIFGTTPG
jgi:DNA-binding beta-propeller fold protein YncE